MQRHLLAIVLTPVLALSLTGCVRDNGPARTPHSVSSTATFWGFKPSPVTADM